MAQRDNAMGWQFDNSYSRLPDALFARQQPVAVRAPKLVVLNDQLAQDMGLHVSALLSDEGIAVLAGNDVPVGAEPIAQAYAGHQFGGFTMLGDGRAVLLGEHSMPDGMRVDVQLKGSGRTPFSRSGDGRAALGPMLREYIMSEAMHALGVPSTRSLAVVSTGEAVLRETPLAGAILTRVAASHIRVGTFEYVAMQGDDALLKALADYTIARHYPTLDGEAVYALFLDAVMERQAALIAKWQMVGFIHGVMNTDNMALSGETIDYGPCAFMDRYDPATVFSSIDRHGRYAFGNQPPIAQWNIMRFAEAILPLLHPEQAQAIAIAQAVINRFPAVYDGYWLTGMRAKLGLFHAEAEDMPLIASLLAWMQSSGADYNYSFRALHPDVVPADYGVDFAQWHARWRARLSRQAEETKQVVDMMHAHNPAVIPRNYFMEEALEAAVVQGDMSVMHRLLDAIQHPYQAQDAFNRYHTPAKDMPDYQTFCGT